MWSSSKYPLGTGRSQAQLAFTLGKVTRRSVAFLVGFPVGVEDQREVTFGAFGPNSAGGAMNLKLSCIDGAGHCRLHLLIEADCDSKDLLAERVEMHCASSLRRSISLSSKSAS